MINHPHLVQDTGTIILVTEFTLASARDTIRILAWLKSHAPQARVIVVANKCQTATQEIARKDFEHSIERKIDLLIPYDAKAASQAAKLGKALGDAARSTKLGQALAQLGKLALTLDDDGAGGPKGGMAPAKAKGNTIAPGEKAAGVSLVTRLTDIKKLLPGRRAATAEKNS
jgi:pilus assembly protein CpaE